MKKILIFMLALVMMIPASIQIKAEGEENELDYSVTLTYTDPETFEEKFDVIDEASYEASSKASSTGLFYDTLTDAGKKLYTIIKNQNPTADANTIEISTDDGYTASVLSEMHDVYFQAVMAYVRDYPEKTLWFSGSAGLSCSYSGSYADYRYCLNTLYNWKSSYDTQANAKIQSIVKNMPSTGTYNKVKYLHDWLVNNNQYSYSINGDSNYAHSGAGCLIFGGGVCESYAKAFKALCNAANIPCMIITSYSHAWNYVKMPDNQWYMVDCTWDDPSDVTTLLYDYFLISNNPNIDYNHTEDSDFDYPATAKSAYSGSKTAETTVTSGLPFVDVSKSKWYYSYIQDVYNEGLMTGLDATHFNPYGTMNRGMLATVLYRMKGAKVSYSKYFSDVPSGKYYSEAITWCYQQGIVTGYQDGTFKPGNAISRQDFVLMLYRYAGSPTVRSTSNLNSFADVGDVSGYAKDAMSWAVSVGIISGTKINNKTCLAPKQTATRAECAKMLSVAYLML